MPSNQLNDLLRHHVAQGHIHLVGAEWEVGIFSPWEPVTNPDWLRELDRMLDGGEIRRVSNTDDVTLAV